MPKAAASIGKNICENMSFGAHEAFKKMRTNILLALPQNNNCKIVGVTSSQPAEGKSTTIINLAYSFSELGYKVLLIDSDLRRPSVAEKLAMRSSVGFGDLLTVSNDIYSAILHYDDPNGKFGFDVIGGGKSYNDSSELLSSQRFSSLMEALSKAYEYILIDLPPIDAVIDAVIVGKHTDGMVAVVRENKTQRKQFDKCIDQLEFAKIEILGVVVNGSAENIGKKYKSHY